jgi:hypothetical protein
VCKSILASESWYISLRYSWDLYISLRGNWELTYAENWKTSPLGRELIYIHKWAVKSRYISSQELVYILRCSWELVYISKGQLRTGIYPCGEADNWYLSLRGKPRTGIYPPRESWELVSISEGQLRTGIYYQSRAGNWFISQRCNRKAIKAVEEIISTCTWQPCIFLISIVHFYWG